MPGRKGGAGSVTIVKIYEVVLYGVLDMTE